MKSIARNLLGDVADAEDAVQEAFLKIYRSARTFRGGAAFTTWTYRVLVNTCYDLLRRRRSRPAAGSLEAEDGRTLLPPAPGADHPLRLALETAVGRLKPKHRAVFLLFEVEGFTHGEIARILGSLRQSALTAESPSRPPAGRRFSCPIGKSSFFSTMPSRSCRARSSRTATTPTCASSFLEPTRRSSGRSVT